MHDFDAVVIGAGAAGLFCAARAGQRGLRVLLLDHAAKLGEKIRISGGGRCNFTNLHATPAQYLSDNPPFCRSALARFTPADFVALVRQHGIAFHEKHQGQLFCDASSQQIINLLQAECDAGRVTLRQPCRVQRVQPQGASWAVDTDAGPLRCASLVVATGGLSIPKLGASDYGLRLARQLGHRVVPPRPALVPLVFDPASWAPFVGLAGVALPVGIAAGNGPLRGEFLEDLLFTHRGLSGPAILQASSYWREGQALELDLAPSQSLDLALRSGKQGSRRQLMTELTQYLPQRLAQAWILQQGLDATRPLPQMRDSDLASLGQSLHAWCPRPSGSEGWRKAEVMAGGVDTRDLDSRTLGSRHLAGLYFIGEVVDVTGWLGGYNFQWAWASAAACAAALPSA